MGKIVIIRFYFQYNCKHYVKTKSAEELNSGNISSMKQK